jgi:hypothetical protein
MTGAVGVDRLAGPGVLGIRLREAARRLSKYRCAPAEKLIEQRVLPYPAAPQSKGGRPFGKPAEVISS